MNKLRSPSLYDIKFALGTYNSTLWPQLDWCYDISYVLQLVRDNSSLDDISMLEYLVNELKVEEAEPGIKKYKEAVEKLKMKLCQFLKGELLKASSLLEFVTIVVKEDTDHLVLKDVQRLSSAVLPHHIMLNVIRSGDLDDSLLEDSEQESLTTVQSKGTTLTSEVPGGNSILLI